MLSYAELDSKIALSRLNIHHQGVKMGFGMGGNIKGADNFPLYKRGAGIISNARPGIDALMFHSSHEYDVKPARRSHSPSPNINPPIRSNEYNSSSRGKTPHEMTGVMSRFYGLPPDKDIVIENFAAEATGLSKSKTPERDFMIANMRADADANQQGFQGRDAYNTFMNTPAVIGLIEGGKTVAETKGLTTGGATQLQRIFRGHTARKVAPIVVAPAFAAATATATATATAPAATPVAVNLTFPPSAAATSTPSAAALSTPLPDDDETPTPGAPPAAVAPSSPPVKGPAADSDDEGGDDIEEAESKGSGPPTYNPDTATDIATTIRRELTIYQMKKGTKNPVDLTGLANRTKQLGVIVGKRTKAGSIGGIATALDSIDAKIKKDFPPPATSIVRSKSAPRSERK